MKNKQRAQQLADWVWSEAIDKIAPDAVVAVFESALEMSALAERTAMGITLAERDAEIERLTAIETKAASLYAAFRLGEPDAWDWEELRAALSAKARAQAPPTEAEDNR